MADGDTRDSIAAVSCYLLPAALRAMQAVGI